MYASSARLVINAFDKLSRPYLQTKISLSIQNIKLLLFPNKFISGFSVYDIS